MAPGAGCGRKRIFPQAGVAAYPEGGIIRHSGLGGLGDPAGAGQNWTSGAEGSFVREGEAFAIQSLLHLPAGAALRATAGAKGCWSWLTGHIATIQAAPPAV